MKENFDLLLKALIEERDKLLDEFPELKAYQNEIDKELDSVGLDPLARAQKMSELLMKKLNEELIPAMAELRKIRSTLNSKKKSA